MLLLQQGSGGQGRKCFSPAYLGQIEHVLKRFSIPHVLTVQCFTFCSTWSRWSCGMGSHTHPHPSRVGMLVPHSARSTGHWSSDLPLGASSEGPRERPPVLCSVELVERFPVGEMAGNVTQLSLGPWECLCALVQPCICMAQRMHRAGPDPAQQNYPCCPTWCCGFSFNTPELWRWQDLVVF